MTIRIALALGALCAAAACASTGSLAPANWQPVGGTANAWTKGTGAAQQAYRYERKPFGGTLSDLASRATIDALTAHRGARLQRSTPLTACPGAAGVATFALPGRQLLEEAFSVRDGHAVIVRYIRPAGTPADAAAVAVMTNALCVP